MGRTIAIGNPPIDVTFRKSGRARRMTLRVSRLDGRVTLSMPSCVREQDAAEFAQSRETWLRAALGEVATPCTVTHGAVLPVEGREIRIVTARRQRGASLQGGTLRVRQDRPGRAAQAFLKAMARDRLSQAVDTHAHRLGHKVAALTLRDTRSRWGSCTAEGRLMFSWRLIMAPPEVLDYVAAHEVAHLRHLDHSPAFWGVVQELCPEYEEYRRWLRGNGPELHRYLFSD